MITEKGLLFILILAILGPLIKAMLIIALFGIPIVVVLVSSLKNHKDEP